MNTAEIVIMNKLDELLLDIERYKENAVSDDIDSIYEALSTCKRLLQVRSEANEKIIYCNDFIDYQYECLKLINAGYCCLYDGQTESVYRHNPGREITVKMI